MPLNETHGCVLRSAVWGEHGRLVVFVDQLCWFMTAEHHNIAFFIVPGPFGPVKQLLMRVRRSLDERGTTPLP